MKKIFYKSIRDLKKLSAPFMVSVVFATSFVSLVSKYLKGEKFPMGDFGYLVLSLFIIFLFFFVILFLMNLIIAKFINHNILVYPVGSAKKPKQKILLHIVNDNDDDMRNVRIELKKILVGEYEDIEFVIPADNKFFSRGLSERNSIIDANTSVKIEIAENDDGVVLLFLDDEITSDVLSGMKEFEKRQKYRLRIRISAKIADILFEKDCEFLCEHQMNETIKIICGNDEVSTSKYLSKLEWITE